MDVDRSQLPPGHFVAEITMLSTEEGGRKTPFVNGYRPDLNMGVPRMLNGCWIVLRDRDQLSPGGTCLAEIGMIAPEFQRRRLYLGFQFTINEGNRLIGRGTIVEVLSEDMVREGDF